MAISPILGDNENMAGREWTFWVHLVKDGARDGLLIGRKAEPAGQPEHAYFFDRNGGLPHNEAILRLCGSSIHGFQSPRADEIRIFDLLRKCALFAQAQVTPPEQIPLPSDFRQHEEPVRGLPRLFEAAYSTTLRNSDSPLRDFLVDWRTFRASVLDLTSVHGNYVLNVRLRELSVLAPHEVMPVHGLDYLQHVTEVLQIPTQGNPATGLQTPDHPPSSTAEYFRRQGPLAIDFDADTVCARADILSELRRLVLGEPVSVLAGPAGTGKTVLVRNLAYDLYLDGHPRVYYFSHRSFDIDRLARSINGIRGIIIIEDVHRDMESYRHLLSRLHHHPQRHVLFTTRVPLRDSPVARMTSLPCLEAPTGGIAHEVLRWYVSRTPSPVWSPTAMEAVIRACDSNLWALAHALQGCAKARGQGTSVQWLTDGALQDLLDLEDCGDEYAAAYPSILVALSALYSSEAMTAETYLVDRLHFDKLAIAALLRRGVIRREQNVTHGVLYGLHHSTLATAYWEHGRAYLADSGLKDRDAFLRDYVISDTPNSLEVLANTQLPGASLIKDLVQSGQIEHAFRSERSLKAVSRVLRHHLLTVDDDVLVDILVPRLNAAASLEEIGSCLDAAFTRQIAAGERIWARIDKAALAAKVNREQAAETTAWFIVDIAHAAWTALCTHLDIGHLANAFDTVKCRTLVHALGAIEGASQLVARQVIGQLSIPLLADRIGREAGVGEMLYLISEVFSANDARGAELWASIGEERIAERVIRGVRSGAGVTDAAIGLRGLFGSNQQYGARLWSLVSRDVARTLDMGPSASVGSTASLIRTASPAAWLDLRELCERSDLDRLANEFEEEVEREASREWWEVDED